jgi:hypothetical protein
MAKVEAQANGDPLAAKRVEPMAESEESCSTSDDDDSGPSSTPTSSVVSKEGEHMPRKDIQDGPVLKKPESLRDRGKIPNSLYVTIISTLMLQGCSGMYKLSTLQAWWWSFTTSIYRVRDLLQYEKELMESIFTGEFREPMEYVRASIVSLLAGSILWVLVGIPLKAGLWTSQKAQRHKMHRYMGLFFLIQYCLAWVEFLADDNQGRLRVLPHTVAMNGMLLAFLFC